AFRVSHRDRANYPAIRALERLADCVHVAHDALSERDRPRADLAGESDYSISRFGRSEYSEEPAADRFELARERRCELRAMRRRCHRHRHARGRGVRVAPRAGAERVFYACDYFVNLSH